MNTETYSSDLPHEKRTPLSVIREGIALRRKGKQFKGFEALVVNLYWYMWTIPHALTILFIARPLAIKGLPVWARWCTNLALCLWKVDRHLLPSLKRSPLDQSLVRAVCRGEEHNVGIFLQRGAKPDQRLGRFLPLLPYVVQRGETGIVRLLLEAGANVEARVITSGDTPLLRAVRKNDPTMVELLLTHGARVDVHGHIGLSPLIYAAGGGYTEVARLLLERGADPNWQCPDGLTAANYARKRQHTEIMALCEAYRERPRPVIKPKETPLSRSWLWWTLSWAGPLFAFYRVSLDPYNLIWVLLVVILTNLVWRNGLELRQKTKLRKTEQSGNDDPMVVGPEICALENVEADIDASPVSAEPAPTYVRSEASEPRAVSVESE